MDPQAFTDSLLLQIVTQFLYFLYFFEKKDISW